MTGEKALQRFGLFSVGTGKKSRNIEETRPTMPQLLPDSDTEAETLEIHLLAVTQVRQKEKKELISKRIVLETFVCVFIPCRPVL